MFASLVFVFQHYLLDWMYTSIKIISGCLEPQTPYRPAPTTLPFWMSPTTVKYVICHVQLSIFWFCLFCLFICLLVCLLIEASSRKPRFWDWVAVKLAFNTLMLSPLNIYTLLWHENLLYETHFHNLIIIQVNEAHPAKDITVWKRPVYSLSIIN